MKLTHGDLFSGIGGFALAARWMGWQTRYFVEWETYPQSQLVKNFPGVRIYGDITKIKWKPEHYVDVLTAGFPCQPVSFAGRGLAQDDPRWLWPEVARAIRDIRPRFFVLENVPGLFVRGFRDVLGEISEIGYDAEWEVVSAAEVGACHKRERIWVVGYSRSGGRHRIARRWTGPLAPLGHFSVEENGTGAGGDREDGSVVPGSVAGRNVRRVLAANDGVRKQVWNHAADAVEGRVVPDSVGNGRQKVKKGSAKIAKGRIGDEEPCQGGLSARNGGTGGRRVSDPKHSGLHESRGLAEVGKGGSVKGGVRRDGVSHGGQVAARDVPDANGRDAQAGRTGRRTVRARHRSGGTSGDVARSGEVEAIAHATCEGSQGFGATGSVGGVGKDGFAGECGCAAVARGSLGSGIGCPIHWDVEPNVGRVADGVPNRVARIMALGNAVVPQVVVAYAYRRIIQLVREGL